MFAIRIHGRGGQGVVTAAEVLSVAAFDEGKHAQAFPTFGSERTGAPVTAFCRIDEAPIRAHDPVTAADAVLVQDPTLLHGVPVLDGTNPQTFVLVNSSRQLDQLGLDALVTDFFPGRVLTIPATELARTHLGRPLPGPVLLGAFAALTDQIGLDALSAALRQRFDGASGEANVAAAAAGYQAVLELGRRHVDA
ncbi:2-oxoacid:acceptor oxidoreductase family protein [Methylocystis sp.]|uniref:2-oxoacid:acceptor oxidoreductase family protein n=1 Tax=Methylocystis sp. TaxID=1911079 RepID=UPI003DA1F8A7